MFPGLSVLTDPQVPADQARVIAEQAAAGTAQATPSLVVMPRGAGVLAWLVPVATTGDVTAPIAAANYYIDATTGDILSVQQVTGEGRVALPWAASAATYLHRVHLAGTNAAAPDPNSVEITGPNPIGGTLTGHGVQTDKGVALVDTTTPSWNQESASGGIYTFDATKVKNSSQLPGKLVVSPDTKIRDAEAMAAQALSRDVYDYYAALGRDSWDGQGGSMVSTVHYGPSDFCNSFFTSSLRQPQMVYGNPCTTSQGQAEVTEVEIDTAGHEITHGVTATSAGLKYTGQSGALNESFSDYFGNVIGNQVKGTDSVAIFEGGCTGYTEETIFCTRNPDGSLSLRYMLTGNDFDDYLRALDPGYRLKLLGFSSQDQGGVHYNSAIWNNALWSIRVNLAKIDGAPGNESPLARAFDKVVYAALTTRLGPTSGFLDARAAVEQVIVDTGLDPVVLRTAREVFDANKICPGLPRHRDSWAATRSRPRRRPSCTRWSARTASPGSTSAATATTSASSPRPSSVVPRRTSVGAPTSRRSPSAATPWSPSTSTATSPATPPAGPPRWCSTRCPSRRRWRPGWPAPTPEPRGSVPTTRSPTSTPPARSPGSKVTGLRGDTITGLGTGAGVVGIGTDGGKVLVWQPGGQAHPGRPARRRGDLGRGVRREPGGRRRRVATWSCSPRTARASGSAAPPRRSA